MIKLCAFLLLLAGTAEARHFQPRSRPNMFNLGLTIAVPPIYALPSDRATLWQPGVTYNGGIPSSGWPSAATVTCANAAGDLSTIQTAINNYHAANPTGVVVPIAAGTCNLNLAVTSGFISLPSFVALRGAGPGAGGTLLTVTNGCTDNSFVPGAHNNPLIATSGSSYN